MNGGKEKPGEGSTTWICSATVAAISRHTQDPRQNSGTSVSSARYWPRKSDGEGYLPTLSFSFFFFFYLALDVLVQLKLKPSLQWSKRQKKSSAAEALGNKY